MLKLLIASLLVLLSINSYSAGLDNFVVLDNTATATFSKKQVIKMLGEGNTCVKDGVKVLYHSKNITKKHCRKAKYLKGIRVIKASNTSFYRELLGL